MTVTVPRRRPLLILVGLLAAGSLPPAARADWVLLKDGGAARVVTVDKDGTLGVQLPDGKLKTVAATDVRERLSKAKLRREVDGLARMIGHSSTLRRAAVRLKTLGAAAVPRLVGTLMPPRKPGKKPEPPVAKSLMSPVRDYMNPKRTSFGAFVASTSKGPFANSYHVGDDVALGGEQGTVVSIGDGVVRLVYLGAPSWGGLVILEHVGPDGKRFCSLYGHLGPLVCVRVGDKVQKGQKIGSLGRSYTWANGGYHTHLHFGIHEGGFSNHYGVGDAVRLRVNGGMTTARVVAVTRSFATVAVKGTGRKLRIPSNRHWITGYVRPERCKSGNHGWVDPQAFIKAGLAVDQARP